MRFRNTLILLIVLLGLGGYVYFVEYPAAVKEEKKETVLQFDPDAVTAVSLTYPDRKIVVEKANGAWSLSEPVKAKADGISVQSLLKTLSQCELKRTIEEKPKDLAPYGLDKPMTTVKITVPGKEVPALEIGKAAPVGDAAYALRSGEDKLLLTSTSCRSTLDKKPKDLRDKSILTFTDDQVQRIAVHKEGADIVLVKKDGRWRIESPGDHAADDTIVRSYLSTLRNLRAVDFPSEAPTDLQQYGLAAPRLTVSVGLGGDKTDELLVGKDNEPSQIFVKTAAAPTVYAVGDWAFRDLDKSANDFRDKTLLAFDKDKLSSVQVQRADGGGFKLVRADDTWRLANAEGQTSERAATQFIADVDDLKGSEVVADGVTDLSIYGLAAPEISITISGEGDKEIGTILLGKWQHDEKTEIAATRAGSGTVLLVRDYVEKRVDKQRRDFMVQPTPTRAAASTPAK